MTTELIRGTIRPDRDVASEHGAGFAMTADARHYWRVWPRHGVIAVRGAAAGSWGDDEGRRVFSASGNAPQPGGFAFGRDAIGLLRGFDQDDVTGSRAVVLNVDYRLPLMRIDRGIGTVPAFMRSLHGAMFVDVGTWTDALHWTPASFGAELSTDTVLGFGLPLTFTAGERVAPRRHRKTHRVRRIRPSRQRVLKIASSSQLPASSSTPHFEMTGTVVLELEAGGWKVEGGSRKLPPSYSVGWHVRQIRFLRVPVGAFTIHPDATADDILTRMERISFQGRTLATSRRIWERMLADECTIFLGAAGALSAGGLRLTLAYLIEHRYIDCLVSTGANLYHDLHETRGRRHYIGSPRENDALLQEDGIDRVYDTYANEKEFIDNDEWIAAFP